MQHSPVFVGCSALPPRITLVVITNSQITRPRPIVLATAACIGIAAEPAWQQEYKLPTARRRVECDIVCGGRGRGGGGPRWNSNTRALNKYLRLLQLLFVIVVDVGIGIARIVLVLLLVLSPVVESLVADATSCSSFDGGQQTR
jgi:hypothetical protein